MALVAVQDAQTNFSRLLERAEAGEEIFVARDGGPVAQLVALARRPERAASAQTAATPKARRQFGLFAGQITIGPELFEPLPEEELRAWEGGDEEER